MKKRLLGMQALVVCVMALCVFMPAHAGQWQQDLRKLLAEAKPAEADIQQVLGHIPGYDQLIAELQDLPAAHSEQAKGFALYHHVGIDGIKRPFVVYVPAGYDPRQAAPLLVYLHGGVGRKDIIAEPLVYARENPFIAWAEKKTWLMLFPLGQKGATWWDSVGMGNIEAQVRFVKGAYAVDDNRVSITGFSDGASGSFAMALLTPDTFSCFVPLNGHMGVASIDGGQPCYVANLRTTPLRVINTDKDPLYPSRKMHPMVELAFTAGADLAYKVYYGIGHDFAYHQQEIPFIVDFIDTHPRAPFPVRLCWEASRMEHGRRLWLQIDTVRPDQPKTGWHQEHNLMLTDARVSFGFFPDDTYTGPGVKIAALAETEEDTLCTSAGLLPGDIILAADGIAFADIEDLSAYKQTKQRGDRVELAIRRKNEELTLAGAFPPPREYALFLVEKSGAIQAQRFGNQVNLVSSRVSACSLYIHPAMFQLEKPITVV